MSDSYQATYDAVRSRISNGDIGSAVADVARDAIGNACEQVKSAAQQAAWDIGNAMTAPSTIYRPALSIDGDQWCALYGENLQDGVAGFGKSPALAMADFDRAWKEPRS